MLSQVDKFIGFAQKQAWLDMDLLSFEGLKLVIVGSVDPSDRHDVELVFTQVNFLSLPVAWQYPEQGPGLELLTGEQAFESNVQLGVEVGHQLDRSVLDDVPELRVGYVAAESLETRILRRPDLW